MFIYSPTVIFWDGTFIGRKIIEEVWLKFYLKTQLKKQKKQKKSSVYNLFSRILLETRKFSKNFSTKFLFKFFQPCISKISRYLFIHSPTVIFWDGPLIGGKLTKIWGGVLFEIESWICLCCVYVLKRREEGKTKIKWHNEGREAYWTPFCLHFQSSVP